MIYKSSFFSKRVMRKFSKKCSLILYFYLIKVLAVKKCSVTIRICVDFGFMSYESTFGKTSIKI